MLLLVKLHIDMGLEAVLPGPQNALYVMFMLCGSCYSICIPSLKTLMFVGFPVPKLLLIFCHRIKWPGDLDL